MNAAPAPLNLTAMAPVKVVPVIVTVVSGALLVGEKVAIVEDTEKLAALVAVPAGVVMAILPEFTEGFETADLSDARPLLEGLAGRARYF